MAYVEERLTILESLQVRVTSLEQQEARITSLEQQVHLMKTSRQVTDLEDQTANIEDHFYTLKCKVDQLGLWIPFLNRLWSWWRNW
jgi:hypothetical protein